MRVFILYILSLFLINFTLLGQQQTELEKARIILNNRAEVFIKFPSTRSELSFFTKFLSIDSYDGSNVFAYANKNEFEKFLSLNKPFELVKDYYDSQKSLSMATSIEDMQNWDKYPSYEIYVAMMEKFAQDYPEICKLEEIGFSTQGRKLLAVKISDNVNINEAEPEFLYTGQMHGDELIGGMVFLRLIDYLLKNYGTDSQITNLINNVQIYINPLANPDGTYKAGNHTVNNSTRYNSQNIDLNRNYPDFVAGIHPDNNNYADETLAYMEFAENHNFVMAANTHSGAELINYPFDTYQGLPADSEWWLMVSNEYANNVHQNSPASYLTDQNNGVTNGYEWYRITGSRQDFMNYYHYCREVTLELSTKKLLDAENLPAHWDYNKKALLDYLQQVTYGLSGIVTDSLTNEPLIAKVFIENFDFLNSHVFSFPQHGDYYRLLNQGEYIVTFSAEGYKSKSFEVNITDYQKTNLDVQLVNLNLSLPSPNFSSNQQIAECNPKIAFQNLSEASADTEYYWEFGDETSSTEFEPEHIYSQNGFYSVKLYAQNSIGETFLEKENFIEINLSPISEVPSFVICENSGNINIQLDLDGEIFWYENLNDINEFNTGQTYETPEIYQHTTYYIQELYLGQEFTGGKTNYSTGGEYISDYTDNYLVFDCEESCILHSVKVYADGAGNRTIYLKNSQGDVLESKEIFIENGEQTIILDFNLVPGNDFNLGALPVSNLFRDFSGYFSNLNFPFNISNFVSIKRSNGVWWGDETKYYAYFYDWKIKLPDCYSERTPLNIYVNEEIIANFDYQVNGNIVSFTNTSIAASSYNWDFGDNTFSSEINPNHIYQNEGEYSVKLTALSECGEDTIVQNVTVFSNINSFIENKIEIYPNPCSNHINIKAEQNILKIEIINLQGKVVKTYLKVNSSNALVNISDLPNSYYFIKLYFSNKIIIKNISKL